MSIHEALKIKNCTRCFGCCYTALEIGYELEEKEDEMLPLVWYHVPIFDGSFEFLTVCNFSTIDEGKTSCIIQDEKPKYCKRYNCWEDETFLSGIG